MSTARKQAIAARRSSPQLAKSNSRPLRRGHGGRFPLDHRMAMEQLVADLRGKGCGASNELFAVLRQAHRWIASRWSRTAFLADGDLRCDRSPRRECHQRRLCPTTTIIVSCFASPAASLPKSPNTWTAELASAVLGEPALMPASMTQPHRLGSLAKAGGAHGGRDQFPRHGRMVGREPRHLAEGDARRAVRRAGELLPRGAVAARARPRAGADAVAAGRERRRGEVCFHDNEKLARYLVERFRLAFRRLERPARTAGPDLPPARQRRGLGRSGEHLQRDRQGRRHRRSQLTWSGLGKPFCFALPPDKSATGKHSMPSLFVPCADATITVNGKALPGKPAPREMAGHKFSTAMLAFSETWIRA